MLRIKLHWQILIAIALACIAGFLTGHDGSTTSLTFYKIYDMLGTLFMNALMMIVVPLIMASIIVGIASISDNRALGRLGGKTILYYLLTSLLAILVGIIIVNLIAPGLVNGQPAGEMLGLNLEAKATVAAKLQGRGLDSIIDIFTRIIPPNIFRAAVHGELLGLIFFSFLFGYLMMKIKHKYSQTLYNLWKAVLHTMMRLTMLIMRFAPIGVFGLVAKTIATTGFSAFKPMLSFLITVLIALGIHFFITLMVMLRTVGGIKRPWRHYRNMLPALFMAFSSASSAATLPMTIECVEENARVSNRITSFVLPLGATINMDGTALYECVAALFIAQAYGVHLGFLTQLLVIIIALLTSIGVAGIPAASLVAIAVILRAVGLPIEAIGIILVTDRFLDMCRTAVNVFSDSCGAVIIAHSEDKRESKQ